MLGLIILRGETDSLGLELKPKNPEWAAETNISIIFSKQNQSRYLLKTEDD